MATDSPGAELDLVGLTKVYGSHPVVDAIDLHVPSGSFVTLLGPSGSGKTTTLNMIAGFTEVSGGHIDLDGQPIERLKPHQRDIGMVFQNYALFPHMTVGDNVAFPLRQRKVEKSEIARSVAEALDMVGLAGRGDSRPTELSGGQQQRVALARAIVFRPRLLLMDEPLGALDKNLRDQLQQEFKRIHRDLGITFVYVTHDQDEAMLLSDLVAVFNGGRIEQFAAPHVLYEKPDSLFVARFLGESNCLDGDAGADGFVLPDGRSLPADGAQATGAATLVVRPERVGVVAADGVGAGVMTGVVTDIQFMGSVERLVIGTDVGQTWSATRTPGAEPRLAVGDDVRLGWETGHARVLPVSRAGTSVAVTG